MAYGFGWVRDGVLAGMGRPPRDAWAWIADQGVRAVLSLTERLPAGDPAAHGLDSLHVPMRDFSAPSQDQLERCLAFIDDHVRHGRAVAVHCGAGLGRTGTILAAWLASDGMGADDAIKHVRARRPGAIETAEQEAVVHDVAARGGRESGGEA